MADNAIMQGSFVELSEHKNYLELVNLVSYYDYPNANGRQINYGKTEEERAATLAKAQTLKLMPVKAYYCTNAQGEPTFGGHEASYDADGNIVFDTEKIGVHYDVYIKTANITAADGTKRRLPCLYAKQRIWKDKPHVVAAIKRLYGLGKLNTSWEVTVSAYEFKDGIKYLNEYEFIGNALLGFDDKRHPNHPAYGQDAKVVSLSTEEEAGENYELMIAEALAQDLIASTASVTTESQEKEVKMMTEEIKMEAATEQDEPTQEISVEPSTEDENECPQEEVSADETPEPSDATDAPVEQSEDTPELSALTDRDIRQLLLSAYEKANSKWAYVVFLWSEEHVAWMHGEDMRETEFDEVEYTVDDNAVNVVSTTRVAIELPVREMSQQYTQMKQQNADLSAANEALAEYKEKYEAVEQAEAARKHEAEVRELRHLVEESACFTPDEISGLEPMIENVQKLEIQAKIGERLMAQRKSAVEASAAEPSVESLPKAGLEQTSAPTDKDRANCVRSWLNN